MNNRDHRKITVIDGKVGFTGGYNLADEYFNITHPYGYWKDTGIKLQGDAVKSLTASFLTMWNAIEHTDNDYNKYLDATDGTYKAVMKDCYVQPYSDNPLGQDRIGEDVYLNILKNAKDYVYITTPYLIITDEMERELRLAVKRGVDVRIVTPGTNLNTTAMDEGKNNYLMSIAYVGGKFGISIADVTTGDYYVTEVATERNVLDEINKFTPSEIICNHSFLMCGMDIEDIKNRLSISVFELEEWYFDEENCSDILKEHFNIIDLSGLGISEMSLGIIASGSLLKYLYETQKNSLSHLSKLIPYSTSTFMILDTSTRRNLELCETLREKQKRGSLLWVLDKTKTAMGARTLRNYIEQPLIDKEEIINRQKVIEELNNSLITRDELREYLAPIYDLERLLSKISYRSANPRDLIAFKTSLEMLPHIKNIIKDFKSPLFLDILGRLDTLEDITKLIAESINDDPPINIKEGGIIRSGYNEEIDKLRSAKTEGKTCLLYTSDAADE